MNYTMKKNKNQLRTYEVGSYVYKIHHNNRNKLNILYDGPYEIIKKINDLCYQIKLVDNENAPSLLVNVRQLKPFISPKDDIINADKAYRTIQDIVKEFKSITSAQRT